MLNIAKYGALGLVCGTITGAAIKPRTQSGEHAVNKFSTAAGLGTIAATPYLVKDIASAYPGKVRKAEYYTGKGIEKALKYIKKVVNSKKMEKITHIFNDITGKIKNTKISKNITANKSVQNLTLNVKNGLNKFLNASKLTKGKYALITSGVALLAYAGIKTITNYYKQEGAIDQKYNDMEVMNKLLE